MREHGAFFCTSFAQASGCQSPFAQGLMVWWWGVDKMWKCGKGDSHLLNRFCTWEKVRKLSDWFDDLIARYDVQGGFALDITANKEEIKYAVNQRGGKDLYKVDDTGYSAKSAAEDILKYEVKKTDKADELCAIALKYYKHIL